MIAMPDIRPAASATRQRGRLAAPVAAACVCAAAALAGYLGGQPDRPEGWHGWEIRQGEEMGRFLLGSTVVMLFPRPTLRFNPSWSAGRAIRLGEAMAERVPAD